MKKLLPFILFGLFASVNAFAQTVTATYTTKSLSTQINFGGAPDTSVVSGCVDTLTVTIPTGMVVIKLDVEYDMTASGASMFQQYSYLEFFNTGAKESSVSQGAGFGGGTMSYSRTSVNIATGYGAATDLKFGLHAFRTAQGVGCDSVFQKVDNNTWKIKVYYSPSPGCFPPAATGVNYTLATTAEVTYTGGGSANQQIEYGTAGFTLGTGTLINSAGSPKLITGLTANTKYDFYVKDSCGTGNTSLWAPVDSFKTLCAPVGTPYTENFDGTGWTSGTGGANGGDAINSCWERNPLPGGGFGGPYFMGVRTGTTGTGNTGPSGDHTTGSAKYVYSEASSGGFQDEAILRSGLIDLASLTTPELTFWYHMYGANIGTLYLDIWTKAAGWKNEYSLSGQQQTSSTASWLQASVILNNYKNDTILYRIRALRSFGNTGDIAVDDVKIDEAPTCPDPSNLAVFAVSYNSVTLSWSAVNATSWDIEYGTLGFVQGAGTVVNTSNNPHTVTGLGFNTTYDFYVREKCSATDSSGWIGPVTATTYCAPTAAPYSENFDNTPWTAGTGVYSTGSVLGSCWIRTPENGTAGSSPHFWSVRTGGTSTPGTGPDADNTTGNGNYIYAEGSAGLPGQQADIVMQPLTLSTMTSPELRFWYHMRGNSMGTLKVDVIKVTPTGATITNVFTISGQQHTAANTPFTEKIIDLTPFVNDTIVVRFSSIRGSANRSDIAIDDIGIAEAPTCPDPMNLVASNVTATSVDLAWTTGGASDWNVAFGTPGFTPGSTFNATTNNPYTLTGLTANTTYDVYLRDSCGTGDVSNWIGPITFKTLCLAVSAPFTENFDGSTWVQNGNFAPGLIDGCWNRSDTTTYWWKATSGGSPTNNTGPSGDHTSGSGKYIYSETNNGGTSTTIETPPIDLAALTVPELTFWYHMYGQRINKMEIEIWDGAVWSNALTITGQQQTTNNAAWVKQIVDLSAYANDTIIVRFKAVRYPGFNNTVDMSVDDVDIHEKPTCPEPSALTFVSSTMNSVTLSWTTGGATNWQIEYGAPGFTLGTGTIVNATTNPFTVTGLSGSATYDFYVRDSCGATDLSSWAGPVLGSTTCGVIIAPYTQNFDTDFNVGSGGQNTGSTINSCWNRNPAAGYHWGGGTGGTPSGGTGPSGDHTSGTGNYVFVEASGGGNNPANAFLITPEIDLSSVTNPELTFWYHMLGTGMGDLDVEIKPNGGTWTSLFSKSGAQGNAWIEEIISLSTYANDTVKFRFIGDKASGFGGFRGDMAIDDLKIDAAPNCPKPSNLVLTGITSTTATLSWTTGGATNWQVEYGAVGFTPGSGTLVNAATNPFTVTGLTASTSYDFYVRDSCGMGSVSAWFGPISGTTLCAVFIAPFTEGFDGSTWIVGSGFGATGTIDGCWNRNSTSSYWWKPGSGTTPTNNTGPSGDHSGTGKYMYTESGGFGGGGSTVTEFSSPAIDISGLTTPELRFWYHMYGSLINKLEVEVYDGTWNSVLTLTGQKHTSNGAAWTESIISLSAYSGDTIQVRFTATKNSGFNNRADISIDDISIDDVPTCAAPTNLSSTAQTTTSVTLAWTTGGASNWLIEYGVAGFTQGAGTLVAVNTNPYTVTGLNPSQTYDFYLRDSCGVADVSAWIGPLSQSTACGTVLAPYTENFDTDFNEGTGLLNVGSTISACWVRNPDSAYHWGGGTGGTGTFGTGPSADHTTGFGSYVYTEASVTPAGSTAELETPSIDLTPLTVPEATFWYHMSGNNMGTLNIDIYNGTSWVALDTIIGDQGNAWLEWVYDLSAYANTTIKLRFKSTKASGANGQSGDIAIDDLSILEAPSCPDPTNVVATPLTVSAVQLAWTTGGASNWQIEYGLAGFTPGTGTIVNTNTNPYTVTGLATNTAYDFYVRDSCGVGDFSNWVGPISATTFNCNNGCVYTLDLSDSFGDGWTANFPGTTFHYLDVTTGGTTTSYTMNNGSAISYNINVCAGDTLYLAFNNNGQFSNECGWVLKDAGGTAVNTKNSGSNIATGFVWGDTSTCVNPCPVPVASFTQSTILLDLTYDGSTSTGNTLTYAWYYGDGNTGAGVNGIYTYGADGVYDVSLVVTDVCGQTDSTSQSITVCDTLIADFTFAQNALAVTYDGSTSSSGAVTYSWDFGDGSSDTGQVFTHTYASSGTYNVTLTVTNICGQSASFSMIITLCVKPTANWTFNVISSGGGGMVVQFFGNTSIGASSYFWDFGDGTTNNVSAIPTHTYAVPGLFYKVTLIVTNACGDTDTLISRLDQIGIGEDQLNASVLLYPNPSQGIVNIEIPNFYNNKVDVELMDLSGKMLSNSLEKYENGKLQLDYSQHPSGEYILRIRIDDQWVVKKFVIEPQG